jgi:hypothetical protein
MGILEQGDLQMEEHTGRKRVSAAFKKTFTDQKIEVDRIPVYPIMGQKEKVLFPGADGIFGARRFANGRIHRKKTRFGSF